MISTSSTVVSKPPLLYKDSKNSVVRTEKLTINEPITGPFTTFKKPVRLATTEQIELIGLQTIDGTLLEEYDRVLVKNQPSEIVGNLVYSNGIYVARTTYWDRADDCQEGISSDGIIVYVLEGDINKNIYYYCLTSEGIVGETFLEFNGLSFDRQPAGSAGYVQYNNGGIFDGSASLMYVNDVTGTNLKIGAEGHVNKIVSTYTPSSLVAFNVLAGDSIDGEADGGDLYISTGFSTLNTTGDINIQSGSGSLYNDGNINITLDGNLGISIGDSNLVEATSINFTTGSTNNVSIDSGIFITATGQINLETTELNGTTASVVIQDSGITLPKYDIAVGVVSITFDYPQGFLVVDTNAIGPIGTNSSVEIEVFNKYVYDTSLIITNVQTYSGSALPTTSVTGITYVSEYNALNKFILKIYNTSSLNAMNESLTIGFAIF